MMKRRLLSTLLALCMALALTVPPGIVSAAAFDTAISAQGRTVSAGLNHTAAIDENGSLWTWGNNWFGQLGNGGTGNASEEAENGEGKVFTRYYQTVPQKIMDDVVSVVAGGMQSSNEPVNIQTAAIKSDGSLWVWGYGGFGYASSSTGNATTWFWSLGEVAIQTVPVKIMDNVSSVSLGGYCNLAIKTDNSLWAWGFVGEVDEQGYLTYVDTPIKVMDDVVSACAGPYCMAAIKSDGSLWMWGDDLGVWTDINSDPDEWPPTFGLTLSPTPEKVMDDVASVSIGNDGSSACGAVVAAIKTDGSLWMWGSNFYYYILGRPDIFEDYNGSGSNTPLKVMDDVAAVSTEGITTAAIKTDGSLWMWGNNYSGDLGNGTRENSSVPIQVMDDVAEVSVGGCTIVKKTDGTVWTWGSNSYGQLGNGGEGNVTNEWGDVYQTIPAQIFGTTDEPESPAPTMYTITVSASPAEGGSVSGGGDFAEGASVTVTASANSGYSFAGWTENGETVSTDAEYTFDIDADRTLTAVFEPDSGGDDTTGGDIPGGDDTDDGDDTGGSTPSTPSTPTTPSDPSYQITVSTATNGTVTVSPTSAKSGDKVTITATPNDGYTIESITVTDSSGKSVSITDNGNSTYTFTMPASKVTVSAAFAPIPEEPPEEPWDNPFTDTSESDWFYSEVAYAVQNGLMRGVDDGSRFDPAGGTTRGMVMTILARMIGVETDGGSVWYEKGMAWAVEVGISDGTGPEDLITREQFVVMLYRYANRPGADISVLGSYPDGSSVHTWTDFREAMAWALENGIIKGTDKGTLEPEKGATRAEAAAILTRFCQNVLGLE